MTDNLIEIFEEYVLAEDKKKILDTLVPNSTTYLFMKLTDTLKGSNGELSEESKKILSLLLKKSSKSDLTLKMMFKTLILRLGDGKKVDTRIKEVVRVLNGNFFNFNYDFKKPLMAGQKNGMKAVDEFEAPTQLEQKWIEGNLDFRKIVNKLENEGTKDMTYLLGKLDQKALIHIKLKPFLQYRSLNTVTKLFDSLKNFSHVEPNENAELVGLFLQKLKEDKIEQGIAPEKIKMEDLKFPINYVDKMTLEQAEAVMEAIPETKSDKLFVSSIFKKKFKVGATVNKIKEERDPEGYKQRILDMYEYSKQFTSTEILNLSAQLLHELLNIEIKLGNYSKDLFFKFLKNPSKISMLVLNKDYYQTIKGNKNMDSFWYPVTGFNPQRERTFEQLIDVYLSKLFENADTMTEYEPYLHGAILKKNFFPAKLYQNKTVEGVMEYFTEEKLYEMKEESKLQFTEQNKSSFNHGETVEVELILKNVKNLSLNVYEIATENYYRKQKKEIPYNLNIAGLLPVQKLFFKYDKTPMEIFKESFKLAHVENKKRGIFIVEFVGAGLSSRVLIRKGCLSFVSSLVKSGVQFYIIDEEKAICTGENTGIIYNDKLYKPDDEGKIIIPYTPIKYHGNVVLVHEGFAELAKVKILQEKILFDFSIIFNQDSLQTGEKMPFIIQPKLFRSGELSNLKDIKNKKIRVSSESSGGVKNVVDYDDFSLAEERDIIIDYIIPTKTTKIVFNFTGIVKLNDGTDFPIKGIKTIQINRGENEECVFDINLDIANGDYKLKVLGKNGEGVENVELDVKLKNSYIINQSSTSLRTNELGIINLGRLGDAESNPELSIEKIEAVVKGGYWTGKKQIFQLQNHRKYLSLPSNFELIEGEDLCLPNFHQDGKESSAKGQYTLHETNSQNTHIFEDLTSKVKKEGDMVYLVDLKQGHYCFNYMNCPFSKTITLTVHKGARWSLDPNFIVKEHSITKLSTDDKYLVYKNFKKTKKEISFKVLSNHIDSVKTHAIAFNYFPTSLPLILSKLRSMEVEEKPQTFNLMKNFNDYLSEKTLSDELSYVIDRKLKTGFMGITLEKPTGLVKRRFLKKTKPGNNNMKGKREYRIRSKAIRKEITTIAENSRSNSGNYYAIKNLNNSFLGNKGYSVTNINPDVDGVVSLDLSPAKDCGCVLLVIEDAKSIVYEVLSLELDKDEKTQEVIRERQDMRLKESRDPSKVYVYERFVYKMKEGESITIKDITSTQLSFVDDLNTLFGVIKAVSGFGAQANIWEFLIKWSKLTAEEKMLKYDKYSSNELNLFTYFKDKEFFEHVVRPHVMNKGNKDFIDYFLLEDEEELETYLECYKLNDLNILEKCLLLMILKKNHGEKCQELLEHTKMILAKQASEIVKYKRLFDTVINSEKSKENSQVDNNTHSVFGRDQSSLVNFNSGGGGYNSSSPGAPNFNSKPPRKRPRKAGPIYKKIASSRGIVIDLLDLPSESSGSEEQAEEEDFDVTESAQPSSKGSGVYYQPPRRQAKKFESIGVTNEYGETGYILGFEEIKVTKFWVDLMEYILSDYEHPQETDDDEETMQESRQNPPFFSENFIYSCSSLLEIISVLTFTDLPFTKSSHSTETSGNEMSLTASNNLMLFCKEIQEKENQTMNLDINITQRFFDSTDPYTMAEDGHTRINKKVTQFVKGRLYGSRISFTNTSDSTHEIQIVTEIPQGAIPMKDLDYLKNGSYTLNSLQTQLVQFYFYFPKAGDFTLYPASVTKDGYLVASSSEDLKKIEVRDTFEKKELKTLKDIMNLGGKDDILNFMKKENILNSNIFDFSEIYWLLKDKKFYSKVIEILKKRLIFQPIVWSFSAFHYDLENFKEVLKYYIEIKSEEQGYMYLETPFIKHDYFHFKEYSPLINPRVHDLGSNKQNILNDEFKSTYLGFLHYLIDKPSLSSKDYLYLSIYLLLQDRINEMIAIFPNIKKEDLQGKELEINYDYLTAYLDLYTDFPEFKKAREICEEYLAYPVYTWRNKFIDLANQIAEFDGEVGIDKIITEEGDDKKKKEKDEEEYLKAAVKEDYVEVTTRNVKRVKVYYFKIDLEIMFTEDPFMSRGINDFSYVKCHHEDIINIENHSKGEEYNTEKIKIPEQLNNSNLVIQVASEGLSQNLSYFPSKIKIYTLESIGEIKVKHEGKPLSKVYIKCFSRKSKTSKPVFHKDGYTDLRGTFDYASLNLDAIRGVQEFAVLVTSEELGGMIQIVKAPKKLRGAVENTGNKLNLYGDSWAMKQEKKTLFGKYGKGKKYYKSKKYN